MSRLAVQTFKTWKKYIIHTKSNLKHLLQQFSLWFFTGVPNRQQWPKWIESNLAHNKETCKFLCAELGQTSTGAVTICTDVNTTAQ